MFPGRPAVLILASVLAACDSREDQAPPSPVVDDLSPPGARWEQVESFRADREAPRSAGDGGGRAELVDVEGRVRVPAGSRARLPVLYTAGEHGIAEGGRIFFLPEPFWGWSIPQTTAPQRPGFTVVTTTAEGVTLETETRVTFPTGVLEITVRGRPLAEGEEVHIDYGAGDVGAFVDRHAERDSHLWLYVDADGDGVRGLVEDSPTLDVTPGPPARLVLTNPSVVRPGETFRLTVAVVDSMGNTGVEFAGEVALGNRPEGWSVPETIALAAEERGRKTIELEAASPGVLRLKGSIQVAEETVEGLANPLWVDGEAPRIAWADLHGHSNYSDGTGLPEDYFTYARDVAALDAVALTDHDHYGTRFLDGHPDLWRDIRDQTARFHEPGRFVTLLAYEWTSWIHGHRHVLYFEEDGEILSSLDEEFETPRQLWDALRGRDALTIAHHSAGDPIPVNWTFRPDPVLEPVTEIMSVHGSSEAPDCPRLVRRPVPGNFVRDVLDQGVPLGFVGSGDSHDGHPGLAHLSPVYGWLPPRGGVGPERLGTGGLAAIQADELTRPALLAGLRARRCYATSGPRILIHAELAGRPMGSAVPAAELGDDAAMRVVVLGTSGLRRVDLVHSGGVEALGMAGERRLVADLPVGPLAPGDYVYLRVLQEDDALAWSSPFFVE